VNNNYESKTSTFSKAEPLLQKDFYFEKEIKERMKIDKSLGMDSLFRFNIK
jgi:hypothetical protein